MCQRREGNVGGQTKQGLIRGKKLRYGKTSRRWWTLPRSKVARHQDCGWGGGEGKHRSLTLVGRAEKEKKGFAERGKKSRAKEAKYNSLAKIMRTRDRAPYGYLAVRGEGR